MCGGFKKRDDPVIFLTEEPPFVELIVVVNLVLLVDWLRVTFYITSLMEKNRKWFFKI